MPKVTAIANGHVALKLSLAGLHVQSAASSGEAEGLLEKMIDGDSLVIIVQEEFRASFSEWFTERMKRRKGTPLVVYCPGFEEEESDVDAYLSAVLRPAIGYEIKLE
jgi:vacuolar-type H+-ATPase subunit F/Vma7